MSALALWADEDPCAGRMMGDSPVSLPVPCPNVSPLRARATLSPCLWQSFQGACLTVDPILPPAIMLCKVMPLESTTMPLAGRLPQWDVCTPCLCIGHWL